MGESCSHIGALLFKVEAAVRLGYTSVACTSQPCKWNSDFVKKIHGEKIQNIQFYKTKPSSTSKSFQCTSSEEEQDEFLKKLSELQSKLQPVGLSVFEKFSAAFHQKAPAPYIPKLPKPLREYFTEDKVASQSLGLKIFMKKTLLKLILPSLKILLEARVFP